MTSPLTLDPKTTAFLFMDFQSGVVPLLGDGGPRVVENAGKVLARARASSAFVAFVRVAFHVGYPELSERNLTAARVKQMGRLLMVSPEAQIIEALAPRPTEPVVVKHRVGVFEGTNLAPLLRGRGVDTLVLSGVSTSGVVLSTVRHAADADYRVIVVEDACDDPDAEVHRVLMEKIFPRQALVTSAEALLAANT